MKKRQEFCGESLRVILYKKGLRKTQNVFRSLQALLITHIKNIDKSYFREMAEKCTFLFKKGRNMRLTSF